MVIPGAQIERGKVAVLKLRSQRRITAQQRGSRIAVALGLKDLALRNRTKLADGAVHRANQRRLRQRPHPGLECAREKVIETAVTGNVGIRCLSHVDLVFADKPANQRGGQPAALTRRDKACESGERLFGKQILGQHREAVGQGRGHEGCS